MIEDKRIDLISFTGSTKIGRIVSQTVHKRFGKTILELGGNNACILCADADLELALKAIIFSAVGTSGQRCTSLRRLFIQSSIYEDFKEKLLKVYKSIKIGDSLDKNSTMGPLVSENAVKDYTEGLKTI